MTVTPLDPPSRAGSLDLIADDLALNFANTESGRGFPSHQNHFLEAANVVEWLRHAKALPVEETDWLQAHVAKRADPAGDLLATAVALRDAVHDIGVALGHPRLQQVGLLDRQCLRVPQPLDDVRGLAKMVLMRGKAAAGFGVGEVEREIVGDQVQRASARGEVGQFNRHLRLYKLWHAG